MTKYMTRRHASLAAQRGLGLIDALVAMVIFGFGMAALAALYVRVAVEPQQNAAVMQVQNAANSLLGALAANTSLLPVNVTNATTAAAMPQGLQSWFAQYAAVLPGLTVSITSGPDASGNTCSSVSCGVTATLAWTQMGIQRSQTFYAQVGIK